MNVRPGDPDVATRDGTIVKCVSQYKYLGTMLGEDWRVDFNRRKQLAWPAAKKFQAMRRTDAKIDHKLNLFQALVEPALLHSAFTYPWTHS